MTDMDEFYTSRLIDAFEKGGIDALYSELEHESLASDEEDESLAATLGVAIESSPSSAKSVVCASSTHTFKTILGKSYLTREEYVSSNSNLVVSIRDSDARATAGWKRDADYEVLPKTSNSPSSTSSGTEPPTPRSLTTEAHAWKLRQQTEGVLETLIKKKNAATKPSLSSSSTSTNPSRPLLMTKCRRKITQPQISRNKSLTIPGLDANACSALTAYIHQCQVKRCYPSLDHIHNILLSNAAKTEQYKTQCKHLAPLEQRVSGRSSEHGASRTKFLHDNPVRTLMAQLVVQLWKCSQETPYMKTNRRPSDAFRPFAAGVMFSMRRGVTLESGTCVVPRCEYIAQRLSSVQAVQRGTPAHHTHLMAHRGVNTLQRCMTSLRGDAIVESVYASAIEVATKLTVRLVLS